MMDEDELADAIWNSALQENPSECWKPHHTAAFVSGTAILSAELLQHFKHCVRCQSKVMFRYPNRELFDALMGQVDG